MHHAAMATPLPFAKSCRRDDRCECLSSMAKAKVCNGMTWNETGPRSEACDRHIDPRAEACNVRATNRATSLSGTEERCVSWSERLVAGVVFVYLSFIVARLVAKASISNLKGQGRKHDKHDYLSGACPVQPSLLLLQCTWPRACQGSDGHDLIPAAAGSRLCSI
jgi:hypothetical protein